MRKRPLGNTGLSVSELGLGTWELVLSGDGYGPVDDAEQDQVIERALALGINCFDTADSYGKGGAMENRLGRPKKKHPRTLIVITKIGTDRTTDATARKRYDALELFARRPHRPFRKIALASGEVVDVVLLLHNPSERTLARGEAAASLETLTKLTEEGVLRALGAQRRQTPTPQQVAIKQGALRCCELAYQRQPSPCSD